MFEWLGFIYGLAKDVTSYIKKSSEWKEEEKLVDFSWPTKSGFTEKAAKKGFELRWSAPEKLESRKFTGWEEMYSVDEGKQTKYRIVQKDGSVLIGKKM